MPKPTGITDTLEEFEAWLLAQADNSQVGFSSTPWACPVAKYLKAKYDVRMEVDGEEVVVGDSETGMTIVSAPHWMRRVIEDIDSEDVGFRVTKERALLSVKYARELA